jgi:hypothetical protein
MKKNLISFLFGESQMDDEIAGIVESIADLDTDGADLKVDKKPLASALRELDIDPENLEKDPRGLSLVFSDAEAYRSAHAILNEPDSLHKLAQLGWVFSTQGDVAMANEPTECRIRFLEIDNTEPYDAKASYSASDKTRLNKAKEIIKKGREFATTEPEHDEDCNPVEFSDPKDGGRKKGVGKEKDGADPEGKPKGSEGSPSAGKSGSEPGKGDLTQPKEGTSPKSIKEAGHKASCKCTFCTKYKGRGFGKKSDDEKPEKEEVEESTAIDIVNSMLEGNPGTPPGIMGTKSFKTMKVPGGNRDRGFKPAKGMVQAAPEGSIVAKQTKPNRRA